MGTFGSNNIEVFNSNVMAPAFCAAGIPGPPGKAVGPAPPALAE